MFSSFFLILALHSLSGLHASTCGDASVTHNVTPPNFQVQVVNLPPQFTDMRVECNTSASALCATSLNVTDSTVVMDITTPGQYTNLNDYNFLRANRSIFPTFNNDFIITPTDAATRAFGIAVAISGDGSTLAIGATNSLLTSPAYVDIYRRKGNTWIFSQHINRPFSDVNGFGGTVALSYDGSVLAVGAHDDSGLVSIPSFGIACVALYDYDPLATTYSLTQLIKGSTLSAFGAAVALSATGQYLVVSESARSGVSGQIVTPFSLVPAVYVYTRSNTCTTTCNNGGLWELQTYLTATNNGAPIQVQLGGVSSKNIHISADGSTIALGIPRVFVSTIGTTGFIALFKRTGSLWQQTQIITCPDPTDADLFGASVALSGNGKYLATRQANDSNGTGTVYVFEQHSSSYGLNFTFISANSIGGLAFSHDATVLAIGVGNNPNTNLSLSGGVLIALRGTDNRWSVPFSLVGSTGTSNLGFGVDCSADGAFIIAGEGTGLNSGSAHVFRPVGSFVPNDTVVTGSLCVYNRTTIDAALKVAGNAHLNGTIVTGTAGRVTACSAILSDHRMKDSIASLSAQEALDKLRELQPKTFSWKQNPSKSSVGFIADDMKNSLDLFRNPYNS